MASADWDKTIPDDTPHGPGARRRPVRALAYLGCLDMPDPKAPRLVWLEDRDRLTIGRSKPLWPIPEERRDEVQVQSHGQKQVLVRCQRASGLHATLQRRGGEWIVRDEDSKNGTVVNGQKVTEHSLAHGDIVEIGHTFWRFIEYVPFQPGIFAFQDHVDFGPTRTVCPRLHEVLALLALQAPSKEHQLILGETGAGKEIAAAYIHAMSGRKGKLHTVNSAAIPTHSPEGYLFGWVKGAFTGAIHDQAGHIEAANGGTLVLDEIGTLPPDIQGTLLRVAEEGEMYRLGETRPRRLDIRIIACTNADIPAMVRRGEFREDLYARLARRITTLPPLRDRPEDIGGLAAQFLHEQGSNAVLRIQPRAMRMLLAYDWPQNVRQLRNVIAEAVPLARSEGVLCAEHLTLPETPRPEPVPPSSPNGVQVAPEHADQCARLKELLTRRQGVVAAVARDMGLQREQVYRLLRKFGINPRDYR